MVALVAVGITIDNVGALVQEQLPPLFAVGAGVLVAGAVVAYAWAAA